MNDSHVPIFTLIIPVIHSVEDVERCLSSLERMEYPRESFLVALIDCGIIHGLEEFLRKSIDNYSIRINTFRLSDRQSNRFSWHGRHRDARINEARNYAIRRAPGVNYVFTEDDCMFEPDWLQKFEAALSEATGALGGPDILPGEMEMFPRALDCILNSYLGTAGQRRGDGSGADNYYPRKCNMLIPAKVLVIVGDFPEDIVMAGEMNMAGRIRDAGFRIEFLPRNPVWHRRVTTLYNFIRSTSHIAYEKVLLMRASRTFYRSLHFLVFLATIMLFILVSSSLISGYARILIAALTALYLSALFLTGFLSFVRTRSPVIGMLVVFIMPLHHIGLMYGVLRGAMARRKSR
jgi:GT2 family glycosyltransferase